MKNEMIAIGVALALGNPMEALANTRSQADELLRETKVAYVAQHEDGFQEKVIVKYEAYLKHHVWQTGSSSKPLKGKLVDDRKCNFSANARVYRRAYIVSRSGVQAPVEEYQAIYNVTEVVDRGPDNTFEALTRHVTCGDVGNFASRVQSSKTNLVNNFDKLIAKDDDKARNRLLAMLKAKTLVQQ